MKTVKEKATAKTLDGVDLPTAIAYEYEYEAYENIAEMEAANDRLTADEIVDAKNRVRKNTARNKQFKLELERAGIGKQTLENNAQLRLKNVYKSLMASGKKTHEEARQLAEQVTGDTWAPSTK